MPTKDEEALKMARIHYDIEPGMVGIYRLVGPAEVESRPDEPIKLLEVNHDTIPAGIMPLGFAAYPERGFPFQSVIVEVTPDEFDGIRTGALPLPHGWSVAGLMPRPVAVAV